MSIFSNHSNKECGNHEGLPAFGIYIHIPYCLAKCPYCDFNSYAIVAPSNTKNNSTRATLTFDEAGYTKALLAELSHYATTSDWLNQRICSSIFFGGGTPSLFSPESISELLQSIKSYFTCLDKIEITLEANPGTIQEKLGTKKLKGFLEAGINRISMGTQSFSTQKLKTLGRIHSASDIYRAVDNIKEAGFKNFNLDLIFAVEEETLEEWEKDLQAATSLQPNHISAYGLTIERGTEFDRRYRKNQFAPANEEIQSQMFLHTQQFLPEQGYLQYEISNYAKAGFECQHNLNYWNGGDYLGLGAGAHSYKGNSNSTTQQNYYGLRWANIPGPKQYIERALSTGDCKQHQEEIDLNLAQIEFFFLGLRKNEGVSLKKYQLLFGSNLLETHASTISQLKRDNLISIQADSLATTPKGRLFTDSIMETFVS